jgi:hypothetical protein
MIDKMFIKIESIFKKIKKHGIRGSFRVVVTRMNIGLMLKLPWFMKPKFYYYLFRLIFFPSNNKKRILGVYDLKVLPWSVGDPLVFVEMLSVLKIKNKAEEVDICIIYDRNCPAYRERNNAACNITIENAPDYIVELLPLFNTCRYLGSIYQFNSRKEFYCFFRMNLKRYCVFPSLSEHLGEKDIFRGSPPVLDSLREFFSVNGYIPYLRIGDRDMAWAQWLYVNNLPEGAVPVTLSLKNTSHELFRNADPVVWLTFIDKCKLELPEVVFFVVGLREEVFEGLRNRSNVIIAKDFGTSIMEDFALIRASLMYMGTCSGVNTIAMFSDLPYLIFQMPLNDAYGYGMKMDEKFPFVLSSQKILSTELIVTPEILFKEFELLYFKLDRNKWRSVVSEKARKKYGHPTAKGLN